MIDTHIHVVPPRLPGVGPLDPVLEGPRDVLAATLRQQMQAAHMSHAFGMGQISVDLADPLGVAATLEIAKDVPGLFAVGVADPTRTDDVHLRRVQAEIESKPVRALKVYLGYLHFGPNHPNYFPYYEMAIRHRLPVIFHTGDTYSPRAKLRFANPILVDDVAVDFPRASFVLAHFGNPWLREAAEVVYKNFNVWADLSGLVVGDSAQYQEETRRDMLADTSQRVAEAFRYAERPNRFVYGSDWPLVKMAEYRDLVRSMIPQAHHQLVFEDNARALFRM
jgi:predicted TIM-barrel fold metal-dependent hydrolase